MTQSDQFDPERGQVSYRRSLALAEPRGRRPLVAHCHLGLGKLYRRTGSTRRPRSTSPPQRRCRARWTCGSGWSRRRGD